MLQLQFSKPFASVLGLKLINFLCNVLGRHLEIRFFAHYGEAFDASALKHLRSIRSLSVDCLEEIENAEILWELSKLQRLSFGVFHFDQPDFLNGLALENLTHLRIDETRKRNFDLSALRKCHNLRTLLIEGHTKNIEVLAALPRLEHLTLRSIPKSQDLSFVSDIACLKSLEIVLGGRISISELSHQGLEALEVIHVRALNDLGNLSRFPNLTRLRVKDQAQVETLSATGINLHTLELFNCKALCKIEGLSTFSNLERFVASRTNLDPESLIEHPWPKGMNDLYLYFENAKWDKRASSRLSGKRYWHN